MELWNNAEINEYLRAVAIESESQRLNTQADNQALMIWLVQSVGDLHRKLHNKPAMADYIEKMQTNPVFDNMPDRIRKLLNMEEKKERAKRFGYIFIDGDPLTEKRVLRKIKGKFLKFFKGVFFKVAFGL